MKYKIGERVQRNKRNLKKYIIGAAASVIMVAGAAIPAFATSIPSNFPGDNGTSCNAWHGAPGGLGINSPYYWVRNDPGFGQEQGVITGQTNSGFSASCNQ